MCRLVNSSVMVVLALSRTTGCQVAPSDDGFFSAVASAVPELRLGEAQYSPLAESLSGQVDDAFLVGAVATHWRQGLGEVRAEQLLFNAAFASAKPVLADNMRNDGVFTESLTSQIVEPFRSPAASVPASASPAHWP